MRTPIALACVDGRGEIFTLPAKGVKNADGITASLEGGGGGDVSIAGSTLDPTQKTTTAFTDLAFGGSASISIPAGKICIEVDVSTDGAVTINGSTFSGSGALAYGSKRFDFPTWAPSGDIFAIVCTAGTAKVTVQTLVAA